MIREAGDSALLLELEPRIDPTVNARAIAIAATLRDAAHEGVRDVVSTYRSIAVHVHPLKARIDDIRAAMGVALDASSGQTAAVASRTVVNVPVVYEGASGPDLGDVAAFAGVSEAEVIQRHASAEYRVFMLGFVPGFPYLGTVDASSAAPLLGAPRLATPRISVPAGSVAIAGSQTGIYPHQTPGGWRIIGRTDLALFDETRQPPALLAAGDTVRLVPVDRITQRESRQTGQANGSDVSAARTLTVLRPGLLTTVQDVGRWGYQHVGVPVAGAMDVASHRLANLLVGNPEDAATLEVTMAGPELRMEADVVVAICGADLSASIDGTLVVLDTPTSAPSGAVLRFGDRLAGARAYVAFDGGIDVPRVLGSRSTHLPSAMGGLCGRALHTGDRLPLGGSPSSGLVPVRRPRGDCEWVGRPARDGGARLRILSGPQSDFFDDAEVDALTHRRFTVTPQSDRMGYRLSSAGGARAVGLATDREMIFDAVFAGGIQIPPSGQPILLMADRQTTGGYPQMATMISADLPLAAQLAPGDWVEFELCTRREALAASIAQEGVLLALR